MGVSSRVIAHPSVVKKDRVVRFGIVNPVDKDSYEKARNSISSVIGGLVSRIALYFRARTSVLLPEQEAGSIDARALSQAVLGLPDVFYGERPGEALDTSVLVLVDQSGSMHSSDRAFKGRGHYSVEGDKIACAREVVIALGETLHRLRLPFGVYGWTHDDRHRVKMSKMTREEDREAKVYTRFEPRILYEYKSFAEPWQRVAPRTGAISAGRNNDDADALLVVGKMLLERRESRRILLVVSDGMPNHAGSSVHSEAMVTAQLRGVIEWLEKSGLEVGALGIQSDHVKHFYKHHVVVEEVGDLAREGVGLLRKMLVARKTR